MQTKEILSIQSAVQVGEGNHENIYKDFSVEYKDNKSPIKLIGGLVI